MITSKKGINLIKNFEGLRLEAYLCPAGIYTIGWGHTAGVKKGDKITKEQAESFLRFDVKIYENYVENIVPFELNQNQFDALVSFTYNLGASNLRKLVYKRTPIEVANAILLYNKANGKILEGLTKRRIQERELFLLK